MREEMMRSMVQLERSEEWKWVRCRSVWMAVSEYPLLLGTFRLFPLLYHFSVAWSS